MVQLTTKTCGKLVAELVAGLRELNPVMLETSADDNAFMNARLSVEVSITDVLARISNRGVMNGARVMLQLLDGEDPWSDVERYEAYARLRYNFQEAKTINDSSNLAQSIFWVLAQGHDDRLRPLVELGLNRLHGGRTPWIDPSRAKMVDRRAVALFSLWLGARRLGLAAEVPVRGVYSEVTAAWLKQPSLESLAEHHIQSLAEGGSEDFLGLFELMPIEIAAIQAVRSFEGLATEVPSLHVLLTNPVGAAFMRRGAPREFDPRTDPIYQRVVEALKSAGRLQGGVDPWRV